MVKLVPEKLVHLLIDFVHVCTNVFLDIFYHFLDVFAKIVFQLIHFVVECMYFVFGFLG